MSATLHSTPDAALEPILEPDLPIVDPHHHLWDRRGDFPADDGAPQHGFITVINLRPRYLLDELLADTSSGHNIRATVFLECGAMYRADGPAELRCVGETEFVNGIAAMSASGGYGETRVCAGIVGKADLRMGDQVTPVLEAHIAAGGGRFRGIRHSAAQDPDFGVLGPLARRIPPGLYGSADFRVGLKRLAPLGLTLDAWVLEPQIDELTDLAHAAPETTIILDHVGTPLGVASYEGKLAERFPLWREKVRRLAEAPNVVMKLGGLAMAFCNFPSFLASPRASSEQLATEWAPYVKTCIEAFGADRCMFESNFPVDLGSASYATLWNAFKRIAAGCSADEKTALFSATASRIYRLGI